MSTLQIQIMQSIIRMPEDQLKVIFDSIQQMIGPLAGKENVANAQVSDSGGVRVGLFDGMRYVAEGHDIDECNDDIAALFGVTANENPC